MSDIKIDHAKVIEKLLNQGFYIPETEKFSKKAVATDEAKNWNRNSINIFPSTERPFHKIGFLGFQLSYNIHKKGLLALTPMLYLKAPFNLEIIAEKHDGIFISSRNLDINDFIDKNFNDVSSYLNTFEENLETYRMRAVSYDELVKASKEIMEARFNPMYGNSRFRLSIKDTESMQCFKISSTMEQNLGISKIKNLFDAYIVAFVNFLSDEYISLEGYGFYDDSKELERYVTRGNIQSELRRFSFSHKLAAVLEEEFPIIKDVRVFNF